MSDELGHYGVKGMRWGVRRYQNYDGSLTAAGEDEIFRRGYAEAAQEVHDVHAGRGEAGAQTPHHAGGQNARSAGGHRVAD